jgi:ATP-dependent Clp protease ATP-binding subunit ClpC
MYERFTDRARKVLQLANEEAKWFDHEYIGTEHALLGLVREGSGVAANVLKNLGVSLPKIRAEVEKIVQHGPGGEQVVTGRPPHTPRMKMVIDFSIEEARNLNHNYVGTEHLLLGLLREQEGVAAQVLMNLGLKLEDVRAEVLNLLGHGTLHKMPTELRAESTPAYALAPDAPEPLLDAQLRAVRKVVEQLQLQKEQAILAQHFELAAEIRERELAVARLLAYYHHARGGS